MKKDHFGMKRILCRLCNVNDNPTANKLSLLYFVAIYKPDPEIEYTEDSPVKPYDYMSNLVKDWELAARIHDDVQKRCRQVILRSGQGQQCPNNQNSFTKVTTSLTPKRYMSAAFGKKKLLTCAAE